MRILTVFLDMIRPNRLPLFNKNILTKNPLDNTLKKLGGTQYTNCFTPGPDTPRSLATFATGIPPYKNGCDSRMKWPRYFLKNNQQNIFDLFIKKNYDMNIFSNPNERKTGMFPENISSLNLFNENYDLDKFISKIKLKKKSFLLICLPDFHWSLDDNGYTTFGENKAYIDVNRSFKTIFKTFSKDDFDHIFIFSDHGFKFISEYTKQPKQLLLNEDRTNVLLTHRRKGENKISFNDTLISLEDFFPVMSDIINLNQNDDLALFNEKRRDYVVVEDHLNFNNSVNQNIEIWSVVEKKSIYIRDLERGYVYNRHNGELKESIDVKYDNILKKESSFNKYYKEYKIINQNKNLLLEQNTYMYGGKRYKVSEKKIKLHIQKDLINSKSSFIVKIFFMIKNILFLTLKRIYEGIKSKISNIIVSVKKKLGKFIKIIEKEKRISIKSYKVIPNINDRKYYNQKVIFPYRDTNIHDNNRNSIFKTSECLEFIMLEKNDSHDLRLKMNENFILPFAVKNNRLAKNETEIIDICIEKKNIELEIKYMNRFHYLPFNSEKPVDRIKIKTGDRKVLVGKPVPNIKRKFKNEQHIIVHIFIDALSQSIIDKFGYEIMPFTNSFFKKGGTFYSNTYAQSEWTLSSIAGIFTGKYTNEHLIYHPKRKDKIYHTTLADILKENGYYTFACSSVPKLTIDNGFDKGFDRFITAVDKNYNFIIDEALEQLDFISSPQYLFLGFFDIHESHTLPSISTQVSTNIKNFKFKKLKGNSKDTSILYDKERINVYKHCLSNFDKKLNKLYLEINKRAPNSHVILHSDHGISFMAKTNELLSKEREKVVFLYKNNKESKLDNKIIEIRELPRLLLKDLKIKNSLRAKKSKYCITESLFPKRDYEIAIRDQKYVLFFKVPWINIVKRKLNKYNFTYSYHGIDQEDIPLADNDDTKFLLDAAHEHYKKLINNLNRVRKSLH